jgi:NTE family protein
VWLNSGNLWDAVRASIAVPGLLTPHQLKDRWLIDGGLVNPVPVSTCNALGARRVIAVNLLSDVIGKHLDKRGKEQPIEHAEQGDDSLLDALSTEIRSYADSLLPKWLRGEAEALPNMMSIVASSLDIMQDRITRSRLAGEPPDALLSPKLASISFLEFHRTGEAIAAGEKAVEDNRNLLKSLAD